MYPFTAYGMLSIFYVRYLMAMGIHVSVRPTGIGEEYARVPDDIRQLFVNGPQPEPWELLLHSPNVLPTPGKKTAFFTMWEATKLPPSAVELMNKATVVIVPTDWAASCFSACGVTIPIRVVPLGIDPAIWKPRPHWHERKEEVNGAPAECIFGAAGRLAHGGMRKGVNEVIEMFQTAFPTERDVMLKVKSFPDCKVECEDIRVRINTDFLTEPQLADWFASLDCFVSAAKGEGWGLHPHQAMAIGRPVIAPLFGGLTQFMHRDNCLPVKYTLAEARGLYAGSGHWCEPWSSDIINKMKWVYLSPSHFAEVGATAAKSVARYTSEASGRGVVDVLREFGAIP